MSHNRFQVGDRVIRRQDVFDDRSPFMHGEVTERYSYTSESVKDMNGNGIHYAEVYCVCWDKHLLGRNVERRGYLRNGIGPEKKGDSK